MFVLTFLFVYISIEFCIGGEPYYAAEWSDVIRSCPDFENTYFSCDDIELGSSPASEDDDAGMALSGTLTFLKDLEEGFLLDLEVFKCTELGDEPMYSAEADFCSSIKNTDTPWYPLVGKLNSTSCPIRKNAYSLDGLIISIDFAKDIMTHELCGEYTVRFVIKNNLDMLSCHIVSIAVVEKYKDEE